MSGGLLRSRYNDGDYQAFFEAVKDCYEGIELYTGQFTNAESEGLMAIAEDLGLEVVSVHPDSLTELHRTENGSKELVTEVNEYTCRYENEKRTKTRDVDNMTFHPPQSEEPLTDADWDVVVNNLSKAEEKLSKYSNGGVVSLENCAEFEPRYIISCLGDVQALERAAEDQGETVNMTLDLGHAPGHTYEDMAELVYESENLMLSNLHVHDKILEDKTLLSDMRSDYGFPDGKEIGTTDWEGEVDHLPIGQGEVDFDAVSKFVEGDDLMTLELHPSWAERPRAVRESAENLDRLIH
nr:MAG: xylose isomerase-like TIM barrel [Candidatus Nanosalinarum sp. J07AB56]